MDLDATLNSHPIIQTVSHPDQITEIFDAISYSKGASVLRMLENFLSPAEFQLGVSKFLKKFQYANAVTNDLWDVLESVSSKDLDVTKIMDTWTRQMGYPVIQVKRLGNDGTKFRLRQERYLLDSSADDRDLSKPYKWEVPITWISSLNPSEPKQKWLSSNAHHMDLTMESGTEWVKFNVGQYGYYRVNYPRDMWLEFSQMLQDNPDQFSKLGFQDMSCVLALLFFDRTQAGLGGYKCLKPWLQNAPN